MYSISLLLCLVQGHLCCCSYLEIITLSIVSAESFLKTRTLKASRVFQMQPDWSLSSDSGFWPNAKELLSLSIEWQLNLLLQHTLVFLLIWCNCLDASKLYSFSHFLWPLGEILGVRQGFLLILSKGEVPSIPSVNLVNKPLKPAAILICPGNVWSLPWKSSSWLKIGNRELSE